ncbi:MAG: MaoC family dehydratase [Rhizobiaceae bacterium]
MLSFDDFTAGRVFELPPHTITSEEIVEFASEYDPQPFHMDAESSQAQLVGGLISSGWHTCSILMRMICDGYLLNSTSQGSPGLEEIRWLRPVRPGDTLRASAEVVESRRSKSKPDLGIVTFVYRMENQHGDPVMRTRGIGLFTDGTDTS